MSSLALQRTLGISASVVVILYDIIRFVKDASNEYVFKANYSSLRKSLYNLISNGESAIYKFDPLGVSTI